VQTEIIFSGFGGQGVLFAGQLLAYAAMDEGLQVSWIPSYGPEMRGGTAHCTVIIANDDIGSPLVRCPAAVVAMNLPSLNRYEHLLVPGGVLVVNASLARPDGSQGPARADLRRVEIPASQIAEALGHVQLANMILTGALLAATQVLPVEAVDRALVNHLPERHRRLLEANRSAVRRGAELAAAAPA
jgi:2-oxoglutarate ferredoxin oxidoreductase subunit gamma